MNVPILLIGVFSYIFGIVTIYLDLAPHGYKNIFIMLSGVICGLIGIGLIFKVILEFFDSNTEAT